MPDPLSPPGHVPLPVMGGVAPTADTERGEGEKREASHPRVRSERGAYRVS